MSSLLGTNLEREKKSEEKGSGEMPSTRHEPVYHATHGCQAASLSLTTVSLRGLFWACQVESQKKLCRQASLEKDILKSRQVGGGVLAKAQLFATGFPPPGELLTQAVPGLRLLHIQSSREEALPLLCQRRHDAHRSWHHSPCNRPSSSPNASLVIAH